jgi:hypothetical protein
MRAADPSEPSDYSAWIKGYATRQTIEHPMCIWGLAADPAQEVETDVSFSAPFTDDGPCVATVEGGQGRVTEPGSTRARPLRRGETVRPGARLASRNGRLRLTVGQARMSVSGTVELSAPSDCRRKSTFRLRVSGRLRMLLTQPLGGPADIQITTSNGRVRVRAAGSFDVSTGGTAARPRTTLRVEQGSASLRNPGRPAVTRTVRAGQTSTISGRSGVPSRPRRARR